MEITKFRQKVYDFVKTIPKGKTVTYKEVAVAIGHPKAYRAVGNALNKNPFPFDKHFGRELSAERLRASCSMVPCHRVIKSDGSIGGFVHGTRKKVKLLQDEQTVF